MSTPRAQHVELRPISEADLPTLFEHQRDPDACRMAVVNPRDAATYFPHWAKVLVDPKVVPRAIIADGQLAGTINVFQRDGMDMIGYWIGREHWGRGIASRALALMLQEVPIRPLRAQAARSNVASIRILTRCGFVITAFEHQPASERFPACEVAKFILE